MAKATTIAIPENPALTTFRTKSDTGIAALKKRYGSVVVKGRDDAAGYEVAKLARDDVRGYRLEIEDTRVELKADSLAYGRAVDAEAKRLQSLLAPLEQLLVDQLEVVDGPKRAEKAERERLFKEKIDLRLQQLLAVGVVERRDLVEGMGDDEFTQRLATASAAFRQKKEDERKQRQAQKLEEERQTKERERLAAERAELERGQAELRRQQEAQRVQADERDRVERERVADEERKREEEASRPLREQLLAIANELDEIAAKRLSGNTNAKAVRAMNVLRAAAIDIRATAKGR